MSITTKKAQALLSASLAQTVTTAPAPMSPDCAEALAQYAEAEAVAKLLDKSIVFEHEPCLVPPKSQRISDYKARAGIVASLGTIDNIREALSLDGLALEHYNHIERNHKKSRQAEACARLSIVPQTITDYLVHVLAPQCASGHFSNNDTSADSARMVHGSAQTRDFHNCLPSAALAIWYQFATGESKTTNKRASFDIFNAKFAPRCNAIAEAIAHRMRQEKQAPVEKKAPAKKAKRTVKKAK